MEETDSGFCQMTLLQGQYAFGLFGRSLRRPVGVPALLTRRSLTTSVACIGSCVCS
jgi:hypothetical protein